MDEDVSAVKKATAKPAVKRARKKAVAKPEVENLEEDQISADVFIMTENPKTLLFMKTGISYTTAAGVLFTKTHPFQLVDVFESRLLVDMPEDRFRLAEAEEAKNYYGQ